jgi:uncharacterized membrane protein
MGDMSLFALQQSQVSEVVTVTVTVSHTAVTVQLSVLFAERHTFVTSLKKYSVLLQSKGSMRHDNMYIDGQNPAHFPPHWVEHGAVNWQFENVIVFAF